MYCVRNALHRWERLRNRYDIHTRCVDGVKAILDSHGVEYTVVGREELDRQHIARADLVIAVGVRIDVCNE